MDPNVPQDIPPVIEPPVMSPPVQPLQNPITPPQRNILSDFLFKIKFYLKVGKYNSLGMIGIGIFLVLLLGIGTASAITVYSNVKLPFFKDHKKDLTLIFYKIPLIPKNPEQILLAAVDKNTRLKTYNPDFSFTAQLTNTNVEAVSLDLQVNGPVDITNEKKFAFDINAKAALNFLGKSYEVDGKIKKKDDTFYFKIDKVPDQVVSMLGGIYSVDPKASNPSDEIRKNLEEVFQNWIKYEMKNLPTEARKELEKNIESTSVTNQVREEAQDFLLGSSILPEVKKLKDETIDGVSTYHLLLNPNKEKTKKIILEYVKKNMKITKAEDLQIADTVASSFEQLHLELWVGKGDAIVRKTSLQTQMSLDFIPKLMQRSYGGSTTPATLLSEGNPIYPGLGDIGTSHLAFSTVLLLKDVNKKVTITIPEKAMTYEEYYKALQDSTLTGEQRMNNSKKKVYDLDFEAFAKGLSKYYVDKGVYPTTLSELLASRYIPDYLSSHLASYQYRRGINGNKYILYTQFTSTGYDTTYYTPYYGITSDYPTPYQLSTNSFSNIDL